MPAPPSASTTLIPHSPEEGEFGIYKTHSANCAAMPMNIRNETIPVRMTRPSALERDMIGLLDILEVAHRKQRLSHY